RCALADDLCRTEDPAFADLGGRASKCHYPSRTTGIPLPECQQVMVRADAEQTRPILELRSLSKTFGHGASQFKALDGVSLDLLPGETLGLVGESGSGKSTLARSVLGLTRPDAGGQILLDGQPVGATLATRSHDQVKSLQIVFQN